MKELYGQDLEEYLALICSSHLRLGPGPVLEGDPHALDLTVAGALGLMSGWRTTHPIPADLHVIHDASSQMVEQERVWNALVEPSLEPLITGYDRRTVEFPIGVKDTKFAFSEQLAGVQIADVLAGAVARAMGSVLAPANDEYGKALRHLIGGRKVFITDFIWPDKAVTPSELGTEGVKYGDLLDDVAQILQRAGIRWPPT